MLDGTDTSGGATNFYWGAKPLPFHSPLSLSSPSSPSLRSIAVPPSLPIP